jgi:hypothetical protein
LADEVLATTETVAKPTLDDVAAGLLIPDPATEKKERKPAQPTRKAATQDTDEPAPAAPEAATADPEPQPEDQDTDDSDDADDGEDDDGFLDMLRFDATDTDEDGDAAPSDGDADEDVDDEDDPVFDVKIDGKTSKHKLSALKKAMAGEGAIEARLQQATEIIKQADVDAKQNVETASAVAARLQHVFNHYNTALFAPQVAQPDPAMEQTDPIGYVTQHERFRQDQERIRTEQAQMQGVIQQANDIQQQADQTFIADQFSQLVSKVPKLKDKKFAKVFTSEVSKGAKALGFTPEEVAGNKDHRLMLMAAKAAAWDRSQAQSTSKKVRVTQPTTPPPVRGKSALKRSGGNKRKAVSRVVKERAIASGKVEDVTAYLIDTSG